MTALTTLDFLRVAGYSVATFAVLAWVICCLIEDEVLLPAWAWAGIDRTVTAASGLWRLLRPLRPAAERRWPAQGRHRGTQRLDNPEDEDTDTLAVFRELNTHHDVPAYEPHDETPSAVATPPAAADGSQHPGPDEPDCSLPADVDTATVTGPGTDLYALIEQHRQSTVADTWLAELIQGALDGYGSVAAFMAATL